MFEFAEVTKDMTAKEILNYYRNLYYAEPQVTERGIVANAINDVLADVAPKSEVVRCKDCIFYRNHPNGLCYAWTEPCENERGYKGDVHCVDEDDFCSFAELKKKYTEEKV